MGACKSYLYFISAGAIALFLVIGLSMTLTGCNKDVFNGCTKKIYEGHLDNKSVDISGCYRTFCYTAVFIFRHNKGQCAILYDFDAKIDADYQYNKILFDTEYDLVEDDTRHPVNGIDRCTFYSNEQKSVWISGIFFLSAAGFIISIMVLDFVRYKLAKMNFVKNKIQNSPKV